MLTSLLAVLLGVAPASAYWSAAASGAAGAPTGTVAAPVEVTVPATAAGGVPVGWTPGAGGVAPSGYYVTRHAGGTTAPACASSPTALVVGTTCTDTAVPDGQYSYVVTAVRGSWTTSSAASAVVDVVSAARLAFTGQPADTAAGTIAPPVTVALQAADGTAFPSSGVPVTLTIGTNPAGGSLSGTTVVLTDGSGAATFDDLSFDEPGTGYTLVATSPGLTSATGSPFAVTAPLLLGAAGGFSVLAGTAVVNTGPTTISGDVGVSPGTSITGFPDGSVGGDVHAGDAVAALAQTALARAYDELAARAADMEVIGDLGGLTLTPGVHHSVAALALTGTLTLDAEGDPDAVFVFRTDAAFNTAAGSVVNLVGGAQAGNVFWVVAGAAGTGANSFLSGTVLARGAITLGASTALVGRALSRDAVTLAGDTLTGVAPGQPASPAGTAPLVAAEVAPIPPPPTTTEPAASGTPGSAGETEPDQPEPTPTTSAPEPAPTTSAPDAAPTTGATEPEETVIP